MENSSAVDTACWQMTVASYSLLLYFWYYTTINNNNTKIYNAHM